MNYTYGPIRRTRNGENEPNDILRTFMFMISRPVTLSNGNFLILGPRSFQKKFTFVYYHGFKAEAFDLCLDSSCGLNLGSFQDRGRN